MLCAQRIPFFVDYVRHYTDLPFLVKLEERDGALVPGKNLTAADLGQDVENAAFKPVLLDGATDTVAVPHGFAGIPLRRRRRRQVEPGSRGPGTGADRAQARRARPR